MRILHVAESAKGGVGTYISELAAMQAEALGIDSVRIVAPDSHASQISAPPPETLITYRRPDRSRASLMNLAEAVRDAVNSFAPDVIHVHSTFAGIVVRGLFGWRLHRPAIIYCPHGWAFDMEGSSLKRWAAAKIERLLSGMCDKVIAISEHEAHVGATIGISERKLATVRNGLSDVESVDPAVWTADGLKVLFVGRLDRQKGFDTLVNALEPLGDRVSARAVGEAVADSPPLSPTTPRSIEMLGWLPERAIRAQLAAADVLVVPSRWEGFGLVAVEAMRAGKMVIASKVGGLKEVVDDDVTGWLVAPDSPVELSARLATLTRDCASKMGETGRRKFLDQFSGDRVHRQLLAIYDSCLSRVHMDADLAVHA